MHDGTRLGAPESFDSVSVSGHLRRKPMNPIPVYLIAAPIGSYLSDMSMASLQQIQSTKVLFLESHCRFVRKLQAKGYITP